jgi:hypothetical protein
MTTEPTLDGTVKYPGLRKLGWVEPAAQINLSDEQAADLIRCLPESRGIPEVLSGEKGMRWQFINGLTLDYEGATGEFWLRSDGIQYKPGAFKR